MYLIFSVFFIIATTVRNSNGFVVTPRKIAFTRTTCLSAGAEEETDLWESLRARQSVFEKRKFELNQKWKNADCDSKPRVALSDWVRRLDVSDYPVVACGSASGTIFVANLETGQVVAQSVPSESDNQDVAQEDVTDEDTLRLLYGNYDGGGILAIAMHRNLVCSAGRQGGVQIWRHDVESPVLISQGDLQAFPKTMVTSLELLDDLLWVADAEGNLKAYYHSSPTTPLPLQRTATFSYKFNSTITSLYLHPEESIGLVTTAMDGVHVFSFDDAKDSDQEVPLKVLASWEPRFRKDEYAQSAVLVPRHDKDNNEDGCSVVCGASDGTLHIQSLNWNCEASTPVNQTKPFLEDEDQCRPSHLAAVKCIACPSPEVMVTGGQDGTLRVWELSSSEPPRCLYQFIGYKVWLGSMWTDGIRLVSDGNDNTVVVHDFGKDVDTTDL